MANSSCLPINFTIVCESDDHLPLKDIPDHREVILLFQKGGMSAYRKKTFSDQYTKFSSNCLFI